MVPHCAMAAGKYRSKGDPGPRDLLIHIDKIIVGQGKMEKNISSQLLVTSQRKHNQCGVAVVVLCVYSQWCWAEGTSQGL